MLKQLFGKQPIDIWVIKQVDHDLLHLCGRGTLAAKPNRKAVMAALAESRYTGPVTMARGGRAVLNARLFQALVPLDELQLLSDGRARWQGRDWQVAQVPQRCWLFEGRLVAQPDPLNGGGALVSVEDVTDILHQVKQEMPHHLGRVVFRPENQNEEHPLLAPRREEQRLGLRPKQAWEWRHDRD
ncbi:hypothetical protein IOC61_01685 [Halomonas sp. KAO]|uniref:hypothetical protein n=1 Tax=Halomonas sp. KAO TaxID=2783858 RepID=UPI00189FBD94|nr:hypothetical protein [Halomonas sp. KAO]MBF7052028.1 hypothetical protein [Halomonas sp. KAO]